MEWYIQAGNALDIEKYNCRLSGLPEEEWSRHVPSNFLMGVLCILYGIVSEIIYVLVMIVMKRPENYRLSCYKIMIVLGFYDMLAIALNSLLTGYLLLIGATYCTNPNLIYISGSIALGLWCGACLNCLVLVINRLIDLWKPHLMSIFKGNRVYAVLMLPLIYTAFFTVYTPPLLFNAPRTAWFFDPFIGGNSSFGAREYYNIPHTVNNLLIVVLTCVLYGCLCYVLVHKYSSEFSNISGIQRSIFLQSTAICMANLVAAIIYVYMQFFATADYLVIIGHIAWQFGHGFPAIVYLALNKTIRKEVLSLLIPGRSVVPFTSASSTAANAAKFMI